jgi:hypothetical protein
VAASAACAASSPDVDGSARPDGAAASAAHPNGRANASVLPPGFGSGTLCRSLPWMVGILSKPALDEAGFHTAARGGSTRYEAGRRKAPVEQEGPVKRASVKHLWSVKALRRTVERLSVGSGHAMKQVAERLPVEGNGTFVVQVINTASPWC